MAITIGAVSLGCEKNRVDLERMLTKLKGAGFEIGTDPDECDCVIVNTCAFIEPAEEEAIAEILNSCNQKQAGKVKKVVVSGCFPERRKGKLEELLPEVDVFVAPKDYDNIVQIVADLFGVKAKVKNISRVNTASAFSAYLKIADGCDNRCSYCTIPYIKGRFRSEGMSVLIDEAKGLAKQGVKEIVLVAQDVTRYGQDLKGGENLISLCMALAKIDGIKFIRLHYLYPELVTEQLLDYMKNEPKMCKYLEIPLQHIDDEILKNMRRKIDEKQTRELISLIKTKYPEFVLRTTFIVGFPGETRKQYKKLLDYVKETRFDYAGFFPYYKEDSTYAYFMKKQVPKFVKKYRLNKIIKEQSLIMFENATKNLGKHVLAFVDGIDKQDGSFLCHSEKLSIGVDFGIKIEYDKSINPGDFVICKLIDFDGNFYYAKTGGEDESSK